MLVEEIEEMLTAVRDALDATPSRKTPWERKFIGSLEEQCREWRRNEAPGYPLSTRQELYLRIIFRGLAAEVICAAKTRGAL